MSPTQRTLKLIKDSGRRCWIVEKFNRFAGPHGIRQDMFNIIDIVVLDLERGVVGVQSCGSAFSEHYKKLTQEKLEDTFAWLTTPGTKLELWSWRKIKVKRGGKAMRWEPRIKEITLEDLI